MAETTNRRPRNPVLTPRGAAFAEMVAGGMSQSDAYRRAYKKPRLEPQAAAHAGCKVAQREGVKARIAEIRGETKVRILLTLNERLEILAEIAQTKSASKNERTRAIEVYSKIAGDGGPERIELTGRAGGPVQTEDTVRTLTLIEKVERLEAARKARG